MSSYGVQYKLAMESQGNLFLNVGNANRILSQMLSDQNRNVVNVDMDLLNRPDVCGRLPDLPFASATFDVALCFQVLEHMPFESFKQNLVELARVSSKIIISLPNISLTSTENLKFGVFKALHFPKEWAIYRPRKINKEHFWEIGDGAICLNDILVTIESIGFKVRNEYRNPLNRYHHFFYLESQHGLELNS